MNDFTNYLEGLITMMDNANNHSVLLNNCLQQTQKEWIGQTEHPSKIRAGLLQCDQPFKRWATCMNWIILLINRVTMLYIHYHTQATIFIKYQSTQS